MATEFINGQWRIPNDWNVDESNQNKISNYSMDFSGVDGNINLGAGSPFNFNNSDGDLPFSFSMWFNRGDETMVNASALFAKNGDSNTPPTQQYRVLYFSSKLRLMIAPQGTGSGESFIEQTNTWVPNANQWYHLVFTYDGGGGNTSASGLKMYIDKVEQTVSITQGSYDKMITTAAPLVIGSRSNDSFYSIGSFDLFSVFNYELTQAQIDILYGDSAAGYFQVGNPMAITPNPVAFYPLGDQDLIFAGANWLVPNQVVVRDSLVFDFSATQFIGCGNNSSINQVGTVFTMSCWVNTTSQVRGSIMGTFSPSNYGGYFIELMPNGTVFGGFNENIFNSSSKSSLATVDDGNWHHVCYTISGINTSDINVYIDGVASNGLFGQQGIPTTANTTNSFQINNQSIIPSNARYIGLTSNVQVFTATLTGSEVSTLYNNGIPLLILSSIPQNSSLQGWWKLNETTTLISGLWVVPDDSANTNGGLSSGMTASNRVLSNLPKAASRYVFNFTGLDNWIDLGVGTLPFNADVTDFSVSCWVKSTQFGVSGSNFVVFSNGFGNAQGGINLGSTGSNVTLTLQQISGGATIKNIATSNFSTTNWNHVLVTVTSGGVNADRLKVYVNGNVFDFAMSDSPVKFPDLAANQKPFTIGSRNGVIPTVGEFSNFSTFNKTLTAAEAAIVYNNGSPNDISSLSPVGWWKLNSQDTFDGTDWTIKDYAGSNDGTSVGMTSANLVLSDLPSENAGYSPYAIELNGTDENFVVDNSSKDLNTDFISISAWFFQDNPAANSSFPAIIINGFQGSGSSYWGLVMRPGNVVRVQLKLTDSNGNTAFVIQDITETITTDQWNHVAMTYDGTTLKGYVNGVEETLSLVTSAPGVTPIVTSSGPILYSVPGMNSQDLLIGKRGTDSFRINGKLSNISIFSSGLSTAQVATIYNNGIPGDISSLNPLAWWELGSMMGFNGVNTYTALSNTDSNYAAVSTSNMDANNLVNGPGYSDGGSGTSSLVIEKQAPYSFNNALSESMAISNRDDSQASDPYPLMTELDLTGETSSYTFTTPILYTSGDISIDWGDGSAIQQTGTISNTKLTHVYDTDAYPRPLIQWCRSTDAGKISIFLVQGGVSRTTISNLKQWGKSFNGTQINFNSASNMVITAQDIPDLSNLTSMASMFQNCSSITTIPNIEKWDVSNKAVSASAMFRFCSNFIATDLDNFADNIFTAQLAIFGACSSLNSTSLSKWRTRGNMGEAFENMSSLDQDLSTKTVTRADTSTYIAWDISDCTSIFQLLDFNSGFTGTNPNIYNWDTSNIIGNGFGYLTLSAKINSDMSTKQISTPNPYNAAYTAWDVSGGTNFISMFQGNSIFNQNLRTWQLNESTTGLSQMFTSTTAFSDDNYTDTLVGWAVYLYGLDNPPENLSLGNTTGLSFQTSRTVNSDDNGSTTTNYSSLYPSLFPETWTQAGDARDFLQETLGWSSTAGPL